MPQMTPGEQWENRYAAATNYLFGTEPSQFITRHASLIQNGAEVLSVADGEGRNSVFLAQLGARVHAIEISPTAIARARQLAGEQRVTVNFEQADLLNWSWPAEIYDAVVAIFVQFVPPTERSTFFRRMQSALRPGGLLLLHGYRPEQTRYGTGGPSDPAHCYTEELLRDAFSSMKIIHLESYNAEIQEGTAHVGRSALIDFVARKIKS
jgi:cyclopropane fatty-acyl-phospholipid synthase-like methyltransferase